jgi:hypothetical protein
MDPSGGWLSDEVLAQEYELPPARKDYKQVGVRLSWEQYGALERAAKIYGVAPTTMARMLIKRGAEAVVESHWRELRSFGPEAD